MVLIMAKKKKSDPYQKKFNLEEWGGRVSRPKRTINKEKARKRAHLSEQFEKKSAQSNFVLHDDILTFKTPERPKITCEECGEEVIGSFFKKINKFWHQQCFFANREKIERDNQ